MSCLFEQIHGRYPTNSICDQYPDCVGCSYSDKEKPKTFCDTCGHQFSDVCGGCESLDGVPIKYTEKWKKEICDKEERKAMINKVSFTVKGDYNELTLKRENGNNYVELQFMYYNGCQYARFKFEDFKKAVEVLAEQDKDDG